MSDEPEAIHAVDHEPDRPAIKKAMSVGVVGVITFSLGVFAAYRILVGETSTLISGGQASAPEEAGRPEVGMVIQTPFGEKTRAAQRREEERIRLHRYGWIDRDGGIAHIPVERAMELLIEEARR